MNNLAILASSLGANQMIFQKLNFEQFKDDQLAAIKKLTKPQQFALESAEIERLSYENYFVQVDNFTRQSTIKALVRNGCLHEANVDRYWLTAKGKRFRNIICKSKLPT